MVGSARGRRTIDWRSVDDQEARVVLCSDVSAVNNCFTYDMANNRATKSGFAAEAQRKVSCMFFNTFEASFG